MKDERKPPSRLWYAVGAVILVGGIGGTVWYAISSVIGSIDDMQRVVIPGSLDLELEAGDHTMYYERHSIVNGVSYSTEKYPAFDCQISFAGEQVPLRSPSMEVTYSLGSRSGVAVAAITAPKTGTYRLDCARDGAPMVLAFGDAYTLTFILVSVAVAFLSLIAGAVLIAVTYQRRLNAMTRRSPPPPLAPASPAAIG